MGAFWLCSYLLKCYGIYMGSGPLVHSSTPQELCPQTRFFYKYIFGFISLGIFITTPIHHSSFKIWCLCEEDGEIQPHILAKFIGIWRLKIIC